MLLAVLFAIPVLEAQPDRFGLPGCSLPGQELAERSSFVVCFDSSFRTPAWTVHELKARSEAVSAVRVKHFRHDSRLSGPSGYDTDYRNSGWSRGHMVPAADMAFSEEAVRESFLLSNVVPQNPEVNNRQWRRVENAIRSLAEVNEVVVVFSGPLFDCPAVERIGIHQVAVPCATFKAVLAIKGGEKVMYAVIVPNVAADGGLPLSSYAVTVDELERRSGVDFFGALPAAEQRVLESETHSLPERR